MYIKVFQVSCQYSIQTLLIQYENGKKYKHYYYLQDCIIIVSVIDLFGLPKRLIYFKNWFVCE